MNKLSRSTRRRLDGVAYTAAFLPRNDLVKNSLISTQVRMPQISGLKWKDQTLRDLDAFRERKLKMTKKDDLEEFGDIGSAASLNIDVVLARFLRRVTSSAGLIQMDKIQAFDGEGTRTATRALLLDSIRGSTTGSACRIRRRSW